jgi:hypothetical protein
MDQFWAAVCSYNGVLKFGHPLTASHWQSGEFKWGVPAPWKVPLRNIFGAIFVEVGLDKEDVRGIAVIGSAVNRLWEWGSSALGPHDPKRPKKVVAPSDIDLVVITDRATDEIVTMGEVPLSIGGYGERHIKTAECNLHVLGVNQSTIANWGYALSRGYLIAGEADSLGVDIPTASWSRWFFGIPSCVIPVRLAETPGKQSNISGAEARKKSCKRSLSNVPSMGWPAKETL